MEELTKRIDFDSQMLQGKSGKNYLIHSSMSAGRYAEFQLLEKEMAYGFTVKGIFDKLKNVLGLINKQQFANSAIAVNDLMRGASKIMERQPTIMKICMLYINAEDEDAGIITTAMIDAKIKDLEHYDIRDFFVVATTAVRGLAEIYATVTQAITDMPTMDE